MTALSATKARQQFFKLIDHAEKPGHPVTITVDGEPKIVMMSAEEFEGWVETLEIMSDTELMKGIKKGIADLKKGKVKTLAQVKKELHRKRNV